LPALQTEGLQGWQTVLEVLRGSERSDRPSKTGSRAALRRRSVNRVLDEVPHYFTLYFHK